MADVPGNSTTSSTITIGGSIDDAIEVVGDRDWYKIALTAGQKISITLDGLTLQDPYLYLRDANGTLIKEMDDGGGGTDSLIVFTVPTTGTYYIDAAAWAPTTPLAGYTGIGTYRLSVANYVAPTEGTLDQIAYQMTHGFFDGAVHHFDVAEGGTLTVDFSGITANGRTVALKALQQWSDILGVAFVEQVGGAHITFDDLEQGTGAFANAIHANGIISSATVNVALSRLNLHTYMHEIGHALGIGHTSNSNAGTAGAVYPDDAIWTNDASAISIMSYFDNGENTYYSSRGFSHVPILTPQVADIIAMGNLYGLSTTTRTGNTTYGFNNNSGREAFDATLFPNVSYTVFDSGGVDTLDYSGFAGNQLINLNAEAFSNVGALVGNVVIARGTVIEIAIGGSGNDKLVGNAVANLLVGNAGADTIDGGGDNDLVTGGAGIDLLTGGAGADIFRDTTAGLNGDTIVDFSAGDAIHLTDAAFAGFSVNLTGSTLAFTGGALTLTGLPAGRVYAAAAAGGGVNILVDEFPQIAAGLSAGATADINGDGRADMVWRSASGAVTDWLGQSNGQFFDNSANTGQAIPLDWTIVASGDANGDGHADLIWRHSSGEFAMWLGQANGGFVHSGKGANPVGSDWKVAAMGDVNGDLRADIVWRHTSGAVAEWLGQADGSFVNNGAAAVFIPSDWTIAGSGDFDGDHRTDLIWRHSGGEFALWYGRNDGSFVHSGRAANGAGNDWQIAGVGDFNGDARDDVLWRHNSGVLVEWLGQTDAAFVNYGVPAAPQTPAGWAIAGIGDFNGDHRDDIMWRVDATHITTYFAQPGGGFAESVPTDLF